MDTDTWESRANCVGKAFELFEYQEASSPLAKEMDFKERMMFNLTNFDLAAEICIECPVFFQCGENASEQDKFWTVRQGERPGRMDSELDKYNNLQVQGSREVRTCQRGHDLPNGGRCKICKAARRVKYREAARKAKMV